MTNRMRSIHRKLIFFYKTDTKDLKLNSLRKEITKHLGSCIKIKHDIQQRRDNLKLQLSQKTAQLSRENHSTPACRKDNNSLEKRPTGQGKVMLNPQRGAQEYPGSSLWCWDWQKTNRTLASPVEGNRSIPFLKQLALVMPVLSLDTDQSSSAIQQPTEHQRTTSPRYYLVTASS